MQIGWRQPALPLREWDPYFLSPVQDQTGREQGDFDPLVVLYEDRFEYLQVDVPALSR